MRFLSRAFVLVFIVCLQSKADEPIMNMMPRWSGGWGYEFHYEYRTENDLLMGSEALYRDFREEVEVFHMDWSYLEKRGPNYCKASIRQMLKGKCRTARVEVYSKG